ncbi:hypothetical protein BGLT_05188 [Caballeronia glathei]|uniref:Uncharacterized protein n=1 Tax=Caballeronia glathei TaxID=60547 RepID=A0A069PFF3_9BURK|nr:hypothetical protein [Caballeronia glathei]KDR39207.1 hypothetical protein BG61_34230 [Caballeronia glathei]CDY76116.1 hypothetical protein BGLT_05188 [Caballeronia glathei]
MYVTAVSPLKTKHLVTAATTNASMLSGFPSDLDGISGWATVTCYLKIFDLAKAPTLGTDLPMMTVMLPANVQVFANFGVKPLSLKNGLAIAVTLNPADTDATVLAAANTSGADIFYSPSNANP